MTARLVWLRLATGARLTFEAIGGRDTAPGS
jgi:hypothetical protein